VSGDAVTEFEVERRDGSSKHREGAKPKLKQSVARGSGRPAAADHDSLSPLHSDTLTPSSGRRIDHTTIPIVASPSGLPTQHLVSARDGAEGLFVAQQWLHPGDRVLLHTHPVEEAITFLSGSGEATLGEETVPIGSGVSLYIPAGAVHGFRCTEGTLHVMVVFPTPEFAETTIVEPERSGAG
jgi:quercetin dioxygenase-like cupin family protein